MREKPILNKRRAARLAAVQALYQVEVTGSDPDKVATEFTAYRLQQLLEPLEVALPSPPVDSDWFRRIVTGAWARRAELDPAISSVLAEGWTLERCGFLLRACLRAGAFELADRTDVPIKVVITEYVEVARLFFGGNEAGFVNAVLDRLAPRLRLQEAVL